MKHSLFLFLAVSTGLLAETIPTTPITTPSTTGENIMWYSSLATLGAATAFDIHSSYGLREINPVAGTGAFGTRQTMTISLITAAQVVGEVLIVHKFPKTKKFFSIISFGSAGAHVAVGFHNEGLH